MTRQQQFKKLIAYQRFAANPRNATNEEWHKARNALLDFVLRNADRITIRSGR